MILISYIEPFIIVHSDRLVSGEINIKGKSGKTYWHNSFIRKEYINVKVQPIWPKQILVSIKTEREKTKKVFSI